MAWCSFQLIQEAAGRCPPSSNGVSPLRFYLPSSDGGGLPQARRRESEQLVYDDLRAMTGSLTPPLMTVIKVEMRRRTGGRGGNDS